MRKTVVASVLCLSVLALASCPLDLRSYVEWLKVRDILIPIEEISIYSAADHFGMGEIPTETRQDFTYNFWMSKYEITNAQFAKFIEEGGYTTQTYWTANGWAFIHPPIGLTVTMPGFWENSGFNGPSQPVVGVSWYEAVAYCNWRSSREGFTPAYGLDGRLDRAASGYRLPTEVEWEYAAAKGEPNVTERIFAYGDVPDALKVVCIENVPMPVAPAAVGSRSPSGDTPQGLVDMSGNVNEWCSDTVLAPMPATDRYEFAGDMPAINNMVIRSGSWFDPLVNTGCARGSSRFPDERPSTIGFRTVRRQ